MPGGSRLSGVISVSGLGSLASIFSFILRVNSSTETPSRIEGLSGISDEETILPNDLKKQIDKSGTAEQRVEGIKEYQRIQVYNVLGELARSSIVPNLVGVTPTATGRLQFSTNYVLGFEKVSAEEEVVRLVVYQNANRKKFFYRPIMEEGRTPGAAMPPVQNIEDWARTKVSGISLNNPKRMKRHAYAIARSIGIKGIMPRDYTSKAIVMSSQAIADASARLGGAITVMESGPGFRQQSSVNPINVVQVYERNPRGQFIPTQPTHRRTP